MAGKITKVILSFGGYHGKGCRQGTSLLPRFLNHELRFLLPAPPPRTYATQAVSCVVQSFFPQTPNLFPAKEKYGTFKLGYLEGIGQCGRPLAAGPRGVGEGKNARAIQERVLQPELPWEEL